MLLSTVRFVSPEITTSSAPCLATTVVRISAEPYVRELAVASRQHFSFPLIVSGRDVADRYARVLSSGWGRMANSPAVERGPR